MLLSGGSCLTGDATFAAVSAAAESNMPTGGATEDWSFVGALVSFNRLSLGCVSSPKRLDLNVIHVKCCHLTEPR